MTSVAGATHTPDATSSLRRRGAAGDVPLILVVDDEEEVRRFLVALLGQHGFRAEAVSTPGEAFQRVLAGGIDAMLLDVMLPGEDGTSLCRRLRAEPIAARLPIVMVSARREEEDAINAFDAGADDFVGKPFRSDELVVRLRAALAARRSQERLRDAEADQRAILSLTQRMATSLDPVDILFEVATAARDLLGASRAAVVLLEESGKGRIVAASEDAGVTDLPIDLDNYPEIGEVVRRREPLIISEATVDPLLDAVREQVAQAGVRSQILFPVEAGHEVMGVLFLRSADAPLAAGDRELSLGTQLASSLAMALRNALLYQEVRADATRLDEARHEAEGRVAELMRFEGFFEGASDGLLITDGHRRILYINGEGERVLRLTRGEGLGRRLEDLVAPSSRSDAISVCKRARKGERRVMADFRVEPRREGERSLILQVAANQISEESEELLLAFRDVTGDRETAAELRRTKDFLQNLIDSCADAIITADKRGQVVLFNNGAERLFGYAPDEAVGNLSVRELYPGDGAQEVMRLLRAETHGGVGRLQSTRFTARDAAGLEMPVAVSAGILYEDDREIGTVGFVVDLREQARIERELAETQEELRRSEQQAIIAELAGATAHELNQPLTSIVGLAELVQRRVPDGPEFERSRHHLETLLEEAERMADIVRKIGRITRYETKEYVGRTRIVDLDAAAGTDSRPAVGGKERE